MFYVTKVDNTSGYCLVVDTKDWSAEVHSISDVISYSKSIRIQGVSGDTVKKVNWDELFIAANTKAKLMGYAELNFCTKDLMYETGHKSWDSIEIATVTGVNEASANRRNVKIPDFVYRIEKYAFEKRFSADISVECLDLGKSLREIYDSAFENNTELRELKNLHSPLYLGYMCFHKCGLKSISILPGMRLQMECFSNSNLREIRLCEGLRAFNIDYTAFMGSYAEHLYLPATMVNEEIGKEYLGRLISCVPWKCKIHIPEGTPRTKFSKSHYKKLVFY